MNKAFTALLMAALLSAPGLAQQRNPAQARRQNVLPRGVVEDAVVTVYAREFRRDPEVSLDLFGRIYPFLEQFIIDRFQISQRRTRALNELRILLNNGASDEDLRSVIREIDSADEEIQANQEKFLNSVDPMLSIRLQAKVRILQQMADNRIRQTLNRVQNPAPNRGIAPDTKK